MEAAEEAAKGTTPLLPYDNLVCKTLPLISVRVLIRDPYHDLSIEAPPLQTGESSRFFHYSTPDGAPVTKCSQAGRLAQVEALGASADEELHRMIARACVLGAKVCILVNARV